MISGFFEVTKRTNTLCMAGERSGTRKVQGRKESCGRPVSGEQAQCTLGAHPQRNCSPSHGPIPSFAGFFPAEIHMWFL